MNAFVEPRWERLATRQIRPPAGRPVLARFARFRCVAVMGGDGKWRDYYNDQALEGEAEGWEFVETQYPVRRRPAASALY
jgi:hypothetical protein